MRGATLIFLGLLIGFMAVSGKLCCLSNLWTCATSSSDKPCDCQTGEKTGAASPQRTPSVFEQLEQLLKDGVGSFP